jgi:hypothetical protein
LKKEFQKDGQRIFKQRIPLLFQGNYGGDHWLASFAIYALED